MLNLPSTSDIHKPLDKKLIFKHFQMKSTEQEKFNADIKRIWLVNEVSPQNIHIDAGDEIKSFFVAHVILKRKNYDRQNIIKLSKLIPQNILFILDYDGTAQLAIYRTRLIKSDWKPLSELSVKLDGLTLDAVWGKIIKSVELDNSVECGEWSYNRVECGEWSVELNSWNDALTLDENLIANEKRDKLNKQLALLDKKSRKETQPRKKFEYRQQIKKLKAELEKM